MLYTLAQFLVINEDFSTLSYHFKNISFSEVKEMSCNEYMIYSIVKFNNIIDIMIEQLKQFQQNNR